MSNLIDRYVAAATSRVSTRHRPDVERELRGSIADDVDVRVELGEDRAGAEYAALRELGDPAVLATRYADRATVLIGPEHYGDYLTMLRAVLVTVLPTVYIASAFVRWVHGEGAAAVVFTPLGTTLTVGAWLIAGTTGLFVLIDRNRPARDEVPDPWTPDRLATGDPAPRTRKVDVGTGIVLTALLLIGLVLERWAPLVRNSAGIATPVLEPELWHLWVPYFVVLAVAGVVLAWWNLHNGRWTQPAALAGSVLVLATTVPLGALFWQGRVVNPALGHYSTDPGGWLAKVAVLVLALLTIGLLVKTWWQRRPANGC
jgi:hypothetical protein